VADGVRSRGIEGEAEIAERKQMLRRFGYKAS
jgi:adenosine/AMP kinase